MPLFDVEFAVSMEGTIRIEAVDRKDAEQSVTDALQTSREELDGFQVDITERIRLRVRDAA